MVKCYNHYSPAKQKNVPYLVYSEYLFFCEAILMNYILNYCNFKSLVPGIFFIQLEGNIFLIHYFKSNRNCRNRTSLRIKTVLKQEHKRQIGNNLDFGSPLKSGLVFEVKYLRKFLSK